MFENNYQILLKIYLKTNFSEAGVGDWTHLDFAQLKMGGEPHFLVKVDGDVVFHRKSFTKITSPGPLNVYASALGMALKERFYSEAPYFRFWIYKLY